LFLGGDDGILSVVIGRIASTSTEKTRKRRQRERSAFVNAVVIIIS